MVQELCLRFTQGPLTIGTALLVPQEELRSYGEAPLDPFEVFTFHTCSTIARLLFGDLALPNPGLRKLLRLVQHRDTFVEVQIQRHQATISETLRLRPPAPLALPHCALRHTSLAGLPVVAGTVLVPNLLAAQQDPDIWQHPEVFLPAASLETALEDTSLADLHLPTPQSPTPERLGSWLASQPCETWRASIKLYEALGPAAPPDNR
ncbi:hypothetical protein DUI87_32113 [Hirundo rustica rustica]|uniref:Uncharacterized protein n=1 Tax=Hirundo rustica rustica TaxID=333673 RepID=A0A3M0IRS1_HIRRU|nr:hypothetical protein DUI87_32113 [Hirundo rustica rustica]